MHHLSSSLLSLPLLSSYVAQSLLVPGKSPSKYGRRGSAIGIGTVEESLIIPGKSPTRKKSGPFSARRSSAIGIENIQEVHEKSIRESSPYTQKTPDSGHVSQDPKSDNSSDQSSPEALTTAKSRWNQVGLCWRVITQGVVLISVAGPRPSPSVMTSPAPPPTRAALPVLWRRMRPQRTMTQAWRVCRLPGRRTSETPSPSSPCWRTASAAVVAAAPWGLANPNEGRGQMCVSNWNAHTIISPPRTVSSTTWLYPGSPSSAFP